MVAIRRTGAGNWRAYWRSPAGRQESKTFPTRREASIFLAQMKTATATRTYVSPHAGRMPFGEHARQWMACWNTEATTSARDASVMRNHVLKQWEAWPLGKIDHLAIQTWITGLSQRLSPATIGECRRLMSGVMRSAVRNRLIAYNPCEDIRVPKRRKQDHDDQVVARVVFRNKLLPAVPHRYRGIVAVAGGGGLRWGEAAGLCADAVDLDAGRLRVIRTVVEVAGHTRFKGYPKAAAGRRSVPLPGWLVGSFVSTPSGTGTAKRICCSATRSGAPIDEPTSGPDFGVPRSSGPACSVPSRGKAIDGWRRGPATKAGGPEPHGQRSRSGIRGCPSAGGRIALSRSKALVRDLVGR